MKKQIVLLVVLVGVITIFPKITNAESITNINGIVISEEEYNNFIQIHTHEYIMTMSEEKYEKLKTLDYSNIEKEVKYIETTYNPSLMLTTERELTKAEYDNFGKNSRLSDNSTYTETTAKEMVFVLMGGTTWNYITVTVGWKYIPATRSFDVIGFRGYGFDFREGSQEGEQIYILDDTYTVINYAWNGTNIQKKDNGFGISMNIVNSNITDLQLTAECDISPTITHPEIFTSYQHAIASVSLAQSQSYNLGGAGLGEVFEFPYSVSQKYDGMSGLRFTY